MSVMKTVTSLSRLMPNIGGPGEARRRVLGAVANSIMLYAAPIWAGSLRFGSYRKQLQAVQRKMALKVWRAYRTVSFDAAVVVASMIPIHLLASERKRMWEGRPLDNRAKRAEGETMIREWQGERDASPNGRWTRRLINDVAAWISRKHGTVDYHLTQWLTNHGSFKAYVKRIGKSANDRCGHCNDEEDSAEHILSGCRRWEEKWSRLNEELGLTVTVDNIIAIMLRGEVQWAQVTSTIKDIMKIK